MCILYLPVYQYNLTGTLQIRHISACPNYNSFIYGESDEYYLDRLTFII